jgi:hypothetical protein
MFGKKPPRRSERCIDATDRDRGQCGVIPAAVDLDSPTGSVGCTVILGLDPRIPANPGVRSDPRIKSGDDVVERIVRQSPGPLILNSRNIKDKDVLQRFPPIARVPLYDRIATAVGPPKEKP